MSSSSSTPPFSSARSQCSSAIGPFYPLKSGHEACGDSIMKTVIGLVQKPVDAQRVIDDLVGICGSDRADIGVLARSAQEATGSEPARALKQGGEIAAETVAAVGTLAGSVLGALAGVISRAIPGTGPLVAAGGVGRGVVRLGCWGGGAAFAMLRASGGAGEEKRV